MFLISSNLFTGCQRCTCFKWWLTAYNDFWKHQGQGAWRQVVFWKPSRLCRSNWNTLKYWGKHLWFVWKKSIGFQSMRTVLNQKEREAINIEDELLATLLNPQGGIIQIAENIFEIDALNEIVTVYSAPETREKKW